MSNLSLTLDKSFGRILVLLFMTLVIQSVFIFSSFALDPPTGFTAAAISPTIVEMSWTAAPGADGYYIYRDGVQINNTTAVSYIDGDVAPGATYSYTIASYDAIESSAETAPIEVTTPEIDVVTGLSALLTVDNTVLLSWNETEDAESYNIYRSDSISGPFALIANTVDLSYEDVLVEANTTYYYTVAAVIGEYAGDESSSVEITTEGIVLPVPTNVVAEAISSSSIIITWDFVTGATGFNVYRSTSALGPFTLAGSTPTASYLDTDLDPNTTYYYEIEAFSRSSLSGLSDPVSATTLDASNMTIIILALLFFLLFILIFLLIRNE